MKGKRCIGVLLALALCVPAVHASAFNSVQAGAYGAYYGVLQAQAAKLGIVENCAGYFDSYNTAKPWENAHGLLYAQLADFDHNGVDELLFIESTTSGAVGHIYNYVNGQAAQVEEIYLHDDSGLDFPYNFEMTLTTGSDGKIYLFEFSNGEFLDYWTYYTLVNGKWVQAEQLERQFIPDLQIGDIYTSTGTFRYYLDDNPATEAQFNARRAAVEQSSITYGNRDFPDVGIKVLPSGTVSGLIKILEPYANRDTVMYYTPPASWAAEHVKAAIAAGILPASLQNSYPKPITRAEFCALATAFYEKHTGTTAPREVQFSDTKDPNVEKMATLGVVNGVGNNAFAPDQAITREQAAVILVNLAAAMGNPFPSAAPTYADNASISGWAADQVGRAQAAGVMGGVGKNMFMPQQPYTREQSVVTIMRMGDMVVTATGVSLDKKDVTLRAGQTMQLTASIIPANAANQLLTWTTTNPKVATVSSDGLVTTLAEGEAVITVATAGGAKASCKFTVQNENTIEIAADLPVTLNCLAFPDSEKPDKEGAGVDYMPSDPILAGTITVTDVEWSNRYVTNNGRENTRAVTLSCRLESKEEKLEKQFYPYVKWQVKDASGKVIDSGLEWSYSNAAYRDPGETFTLTFSLGNTVPGESYTLSFINDTGKDFGQVSSDAPEVVFTGLPLTVTATRGKEVSTATVTEAEAVNMEYNTMKNEFRCGFAFRGNAAAVSAYALPKVSWVITDSSGNEVGSGSRTVFSSEVESDGTFYLQPQYDSKLIKLKPGERYTVHLSAGE